MVYETVAALRVKTVEVSDGHTDRDEAIQREATEKLDAYKKAQQGQDEEDLEDATKEKSSVS